MLRTSLHDFKARKRLEKMGIALRRDPQRMVDTFRIEDPRGLLYRHGDERRPSWLILVGEPWSAAANMSYFYD